MAEKLTRLSGIAMLGIVAALSAPSLAEDRSKAHFGYCVSQPGEGKTYASRLFIAREGKELHAFHTLQGEVTSPFRNYLTRSYGWRAGSGVTCHFRDSRNAADTDLTNQIDLWRHKGWSVTLTGWAY